MNPMLLKDEHTILDFLKKRTDRPVSFREIARALGVPKSESRRLKRALKLLINSGEIFKTRSGFYGIAEKMSLVTGFFEAHRDGYGFIVPHKAGERDIFVPPRKTSGAMSGDRVVARIESPGRREGRIIKILERDKKRIVGRLCYGRNFYYVKPKSKKVPFDVSISPGARLHAKVGNMVVVELTSYPTVSRPPEGKIIKVIPEIAEPRLEIDTIIEEYHLPARFPKAVMREAGDCRAVSVRGRVDCRDLYTVTIDGELAKDFDDAVSIRRNAGGFTLWVHIADVSHYVRWDSAIDLEARERGTSVYFPDRVVPMIPEELSNFLCSLMPGVDRLTCTVEMDFDRKGKLIKKNFYRSVISSNERMTYTSVSRILVDHDRNERKKYEYLLDSFEAMAELSALIRQQRKGRGSLDFDLPEPEVLLDLQGRPEAILKAERSLSHMIIEDFMIAANEAVSSYLEEKGLPVIFRVHEKPDREKLEGMRKVFGALGVKVAKKGPGSFRRIMQQVRGRAAESFINILLLRSLKQARYSTENIGHFGLASDSYCHFTSPIRRYPDLVVHRILKDAIAGKKQAPQKLKKLEKLLPEIAFTSSRTERAADEAEREVVRAMRVWFMKDKVGEEYEGQVSDVTPYGLRVQLKDVFVEGFLHVSYMPDDYYRFDEERYRLTGRHRSAEYTIGSMVRVRIERVDIEEREIVMAMA